MNTTTEKIQIDEAMLQKGDAITLSDLLQSELIASTVICSICIIRKELLSRDLNDKEDQELEAKLTALFHSLGVLNREIAFEDHRHKRHARHNGNGHRSEATPELQRPTPPEPAPAPPQKTRAPKLLISQAQAYALVLLDQQQKIGNRTVRNDLLRSEVRQRHLGDDLEWHATDMIARGDGTLLWQETLQKAMEKLATEEVVMWSNKRKCWVIFDA